NPPTAATFSAASHPGDAFALGRQFRQASATAIGKTFGADFYTQLTNLPLQQWQGPLTSAYGFHFVRVKQRQPAIQPAFEAVADAVKADVLQAQRVQKRERGIADSIAKLSVLIDSPLQPLVSLRSVN
ncbi:MAG: peptidylprolyl isomerase, partial [Psychrosphaera sp.]|nr:peptidylprolyl isomerase [Psychrosphaera sp.]